MKSLSRVIKASYVSEIEPKVLQCHVHPVDPEKEMLVEVAEPEQTEDVEDSAKRHEETVFDTLVKLEKIKKEVSLWHEKVTQDVKEKTQQQLLAAQAEAEEIVHQATIEAENLLEKTRQEAEVLHREAQEKGLAAGKKEGVELVETECASYLKEARQSLEKAIEEKDRIIQDSEEQIITLCLEIAKKVIKKAVEVDPEIVYDITQEAIKRATHRERIVIRVNANDLNRLEKDRSLLREKSSSKDLIILADPTVLPGGCVLETDLGTVDARIETQFEQIEKQILKLVRQNASC